MTTKASYQGEQRGPLKDILLGMLFGVLGLVAGFFIYWLLLYFTNGIDFNYFWNDMFIGTELFKTKIITGAIVVDAILFYVFMKINKDSYNYGMLFVIILAVVAAVYFYPD